PRSEAPCPSGSGRGASITCAPPAADSLDTAALPWAAPAPARSAAACPDCPPASSAPLASACVLVPYRLTSLLRPSSPFAAQSAGFIALRPKTPRQLPHSSAAGRPGRRIRPALIPPQPDSD